MCSGEDPNPAFENPAKMYGILEVISAIINVSLFLRIYVHKKKANVNPEIHFPKILILDEYEKYSLITGVNNFLGLCYLISHTVIVIMLNNTKPEDLNKYPYYLMSYYRSLISPTLCAGLLFITCTLNKKYLKTVADEIKALKW
jgi:hypothetical protein